MHLQTQHIYMESTRCSSLRRPCTPLELSSCQWPYATGNSQYRCRPVGVSTSSWDISQARSQVNSAAFRIGVCARYKPWPNLQATWFHTSLQVPWGLRTPLDQNKQSTMSHASTLLPLLPSTLSSMSFGTTYQLIWTSSFSDYFYISPIVCNC